MVHLIRILAHALLTCDLQPRSGNHSRHRDRGNASPSALQLTCDSVT